MEEPTLWASMAVRPIDKDALRARKDVWGAARSSILIVSCLLVLLSTRLMVQYWLGVIPFDGTTWQRYLSAL